MNERRAADSKRRLTSYVFHEVRVPLNTASKRHALNFYSLAYVFLVVLAVQNMEATGQVARAQDIEWTALSGSLSMMSKGKFIINTILNRFHF